MKAHMIAPRHGLAALRRSAIRRGGAGLRPAAGVVLVSGLLLGGCGPRNTDEILRGGVPAMTNLPVATTLPPASVRTVARRDFGWRLIYRPAAAPGDAEQRAARALCGLERRRVQRIEHIALIDPADDPGTRKIDIYCA